jgi:hypothetical protein
VTDYRGGEKEIVVEVEGVPAGRDIRAWRHDFTGDHIRIPLRLIGGRLVLKKPMRTVRRFLSCSEGKMLQERQHILIR